MTDHVLVFEVARQRYALPLSRVREVLPLAALTPLPEAPAVLAGILRLRGGLLPIFDLRRRLGFPAIAPVLEHRVVVALVGSAAIGILVDAVHDVASIESADPTRWDARPGDIVALVVETADGVVTLLNAEAIVEADLSVSIATMIGGGAIPEPTALEAGRSGGGP